MQAQRTYWRAIGQLRSFRAPDEGSGSSETSAIPGTSGAVTSGTLTQDRQGPPTNQATQSSNPTERADRGNIAVMELPENGPQHGTFGDLVLESLNHAPGSRHFHLSDDEVEILYREYGGNTDAQGFRMLLATLQYAYDPETHILCCTEGMLRSVARYAFDYYNAQWEGILMGIFGRHLGHHLGR